MARPVIVFEPNKHKYFVEGEEFPSVTSIIKLTVPVALQWWGMEVGVAGVAMLIQRGKFPTPFQPELVIQRLKEEKITVNDSFWTRVDSGTGIHQAYEDYGKTGKIPVLDDFPIEDHSRIQTLAAFLIENRPEFLEQEVRTASLLHKYCGTFDSKIKFHAGEFEGATCLVDVKTGKYVYPESQFPQLEAYEHAEIESGLPASDARLVLHLPASGPATLTPSTDTFDDFLVLMDHWHTIMARRKRMIEYKKKRKKLTGVPQSHIK